MSVESSNAIDLLLAESLKALATRRPIEKITIREITEKAGVIRPTFYNHFQDKYELLEWIVRRDLMDPVTEMLEGGQIKEAVIRVLGKIQQEREFYLNASRVVGQNSFGEILSSCIAERILAGAKVENIHAHLAYDWLTPELIADYYSQSMTYLVLRWIKNGMRLPTEEFAAAVLHIWEHSAVDVFRDMRT